MKNNDEKIVLGNINGHYMEIEGRTLIVDGCVIDTKLKTNLSGKIKKGMHVNDWEIKVGKNHISFLGPKAIMVNKKVYNFEPSKSINSPAKSKSYFNSKISRCSKNKIQRRYETGWLFL